MLLWATGGHHRPIKGLKRWSKRKCRILVLSEIFFVPWFGLTGQKCKKWFFGSSAPWGRILEISKPFSEPLGQAASFEVLNVYVALKPWLPEAF